ncbi:MAG: PrsW family intramembrane metalloprotease [Saprospiraceae bacterium]|nr:PrsW family intramembrane metalloprotease [Saprospiraceae bacterium]
MLTIENIFYAILPSILGVVIVYKSDKNREPLKSIFYAVSLGIFFCIPATLLMVVLVEPFFGEVGDDIFGAFIHSTFYSSIPEELCKYLALIYIWKKHKEFDEAADCIVYAASVALGFAAIENIRYLYDFGESVLLLRAVTSVPIHAACGMLIGVELRKQRYDKNYSATVSHMDAVVPAITLHAAYNFSIYVELYYVSIGIVILSFYMIRKMIIANKLA